MLQQIDWRYQETFYCSHVVVKLKFEPSLHRLVSYSFASNIFAWDILATLHASGNQPQSDGYHIVYSKSCNPPAADGQEPMSEYKTPPQCQRHPLE